jgi:arginine decarboxylase
MKIYVTTGVGEGPTSVAAFDAGVANYNLICLSSVIPPGSDIRRERYVAPADEYGHRLYVVMSRHEAQIAGQSAWAGVGWTQNEETARGLFVEIHGPSRDQVHEDIQSTLVSMKASRPITYGAIESEITGIECKGRPVCALAIAVYESAGWNR